MLTRVRRVKCDEGKPSCLRCSSSGRQCDGYADPFQARNTFVLPSRPFARTSGNNSNSDLVPGPESDLQISAYATLGLPSDGLDRRYLDHFRHNSIQDFSNFIDANLWSNYILRVSVFTPAVKHAVLALSAQHQVFLKYGHSSAQNFLTTDDPISFYSRDQYSRAIRSLYSRLDRSTGDTTTTEEALVTCLLFIIYETIQGNYNAALVHLEGGLSMFSTFGTKKNGLPIAGSIDQATSVSSLAKLFTRLDIHASSYVGVRNIGSFSTPFIELDPQASLPVVLSNEVETFQSARDARDTLNEHIAYIIRFLRSPASSLADIPDLKAEKVMELRYNPRLHVANADTSIFGSVFREKELHLASLNKWMLRFQAFLERSSLPTLRHGVACEDGEAQECVALWLSYLVHFITLSNCFEPDECSYDGYLSQFKKMVEHADTYLQLNMENSDGGLSRRRFSFEMRVIYPLYVTALKCRNHAVRRHAISLLHMSGQEGVWNGKLLATITEYVADHEEEQGYVDIITEGSTSSRSDLDFSPKSNEVDSLLIPESARIHGVVVDLFDPGRGNVWVDSSKRNFTYKRGEGNEYKAEWFERCEWKFHQEFLQW